MKRIHILFGLLLLTGPALADKAQDVSCQAYLQSPEKYFGYIVNELNANAKAPVWERSIEDLWLVVENQCKLFPSVKLGGLITYNKQFAHDLYAPEEGFGWIVYTVGGERMLSEKYAHRYDKLSARKSTYGTEGK